MLVKIRQYRLNHKPFSFHFAINADKAMKAVVRIFLGPKYDIHHRPMDFAENIKYFYEMDNFIVDRQYKLSLFVVKIQVALQTEARYFGRNSSYPLFAVLTLSVMNYLFSLEKKSRFY